MAVTFAFEGHPVYQESMAFAYACMRRGQAFPVSYAIYGEDLCQRSLRVCQLVANALRANPQDPDLRDAKNEAAACVPIIDLGTTAGLLRETERTTLRERILHLLESLEQPSVPLTLYVQEKAQ